MKPENRERKNDIQYKIQLNDEQKRAKAQVYNKDVSFFLGDFGSGKTQCAALCALDLLFKKHIDRIFITRPIDFSATGYLTGDINEKMAFHLFPIKQCFYSAYNKEKIDKLFADEVIKIIPIDYMKGVTFLNACTIVDEFEDINYADFKVILSRLGINSKIIFFCNFIFHTEPHRVNSLIQVFGHGLRKDKVSKGFAEVFFKKTISRNESSL